MHFRCICLCFGCRRKRDLVKRRWQCDSVPVPQYKGTRIKLKIPLAIFWSFISPNISEVLPQCWNWRISEGWYLQESLHLPRLSTPFSESIRLNFRNFCTEYWLLWSLLSVDGTTAKARKGPLPDTKTFCELVERVVSQWAVNFLLLMSVMV